MLIALDKDGKRLNLLESLPEPGKFYCPACKGEVILKKGRIVRPHFAHRSLAACDSWSENESEQHLALKERLYDWFSEEVELEKYLPELKQTPDLLVKGHLAIEIQCSSLPIDRLRERTQTYQEQGYAVLWLLGKDLWLKKSLSNLQRDLLGFSENRGFYCWELDLEREQLLLKSLIHEDLRGRLYHVTEKFDFGKGNLLDILRTPYLKQEGLSLAVKPDFQLKSYVQRQLFHAQPKWLKMQEHFYLQGKNLLDFDFDQLCPTPVGLNPLTGIRQSQSCQIRANLSDYDENFLTFHERILYPPAFYTAKMRREQDKR